MSPDNQILPPSLTNRLSRRTFLQGIGGGAVAIIGAACGFEPGTAAAEVPAYVPIGEIPIVLGSPEPTLLKEDFNGEKFVRFAIDGGRVRSTTEILNGDSNNFVREYVAAGTYGRIDNTPTPLPDGTTLPGGTGVDGIGNVYPWAKVEILDELKVVGYTAEKVSETNYLTPIEGSELPEALKAPYIKEVEVKLPPRANTNTRSLATIFDRDSIGGTISDIDAYIVRLWGDGYSKKNIQKIVNGTNQTVQVEVTPTRDGLTVPINALKRIVGIAALEVFPREGYQSSADSDGIVVLSAFGGMKVGQNTTIDAQNQDSETQAETQKRQDIITRVKDQFVIFRAAQDQTDESPTISETGIGLTDWNGFVAYIGDVEKAQRIAAQLTDVGGTDPSTLLRQIGGLKQSGVFLPIEGGGFARKVDATLAQTLDPTGPRINSSTMKILYSIDKDSGQTTATVSNRTNQLGTLNAVQNIETGEWEWEEVMSEQDRIINTLSQIEGYKTDSTNIKDLGDGVWHSELRANNGSESFDVLSSLGTHGSFSFLIPTNLGTTLKDLYFLTDEEVRTLDNLPDNWQTNSNLLRGLAEFIPALAGNLLENPNIFGDELYKASLTPALKRQYHVIFGLLPLSESSDTQERTLTEYKVGGGTEVTTYDYGIKRDSSGNALIISTGNLTNSPTINAVGELAVRKLGDDLYTSLRDHNFIGTPEEFFGLVARRGAWNSFTGLLTGTGYNDRAPRDDQLLGPENPYEKNMAIGTKVDELLGDTSMWAIASEEHRAFILDFLTKALGGYTLTEEDLSAIREGNPDFSSTFVSLN